MRPTTSTMKAAFPLFIHNVTLCYRHIIKRWEKPGNSLSSELSSWLAAVDHKSQARHPPRVAFVERVGF